MLRGSEGPVARTRSVWVCVRVETHKPKTLFFKLQTPKPETPKPPKPEFQLCFGACRIVLGGPGDLSKWLISRAKSTLNGVTLVITLLITDLLRPLGLQVGVKLRGRGPPDLTRTCSSYVATFLGEGDGPQLKKVFKILQSYM